jgi:uncharacterized membrane protein
MNHKLNYPESVEKIVSNYLERLDQNLKGLPEKDRNDFVKEMESHIYESYTNDTRENEIDRILNVLKKLGEPSELFSRRMPDAMVKMGKNKNLPLYILSGILIGLFGIPLGVTGIAILISLIGTVFALIVAYFATAVSLIVGGFAGIAISIIRIVDPEFLDQFIEFSIGFVEHTSYLPSPHAEGIIGLFISIVIAGLGVLMLFFGKYIFRGLRFLFNVTIEKLKDFRKKKLIKS